MRDTLNIRSMTQHEIKLTPLNTELNKSVKNRQGKEEKVKEHVLAFSSHVFSWNISQSYTSNAERVFW